MAAVIAQSGTWTVFPFLATDPEGKATRNARSVQGLNLAQFNSALTRNASPNFPELQQFVQLVADAYAIGEQSALVLVRHFLTMELNRGQPQTRDYTP